MRRSILFLSHGTYFDKLGHFHSIIMFSFLKFRPAVVEDPLADEGGHLLLLGVAGFATPSNPQAGTKSIQCCQSMVPFLVTEPHLGRKIKWSPHSTNCEGICETNNEKVKGGHSRSSTRLRALSSTCRRYWLETRNKFRCSRKYIVCSFATLRRRYCDTTGQFWTFPGGEGMQR